MSDANAKFPHDIFRPQKIHNIFITKSGERYTRFFLLRRAK